MFSLNLDDGLWAAGFIGHAVLLFILFRKKRARVFPFFTAWVAFMFLRTILLFGVRHMGGKGAYFNVFWSAVIPDYILQAGVLYGVCFHVISPYKRAAPKIALYVLAVLVALGTMTAFWFASTASASAMHTVYGMIRRVNLGFSLLRCAIFVGITIFADVLGLTWRHHVQRLAAGLAIYSFADVLSDAVLIYAAPQTALANTIIHLHSFGYLMALLVWNFSFFQNEPVRGTLSPEAEIFLGNLHRRLSIGREA